jgi:hypothetical protein
MNQTCIYTLFIAFPLKSGLNYHRTGIILLLTSTTGTGTGISGVPSVSRFRPRFCGSLGGFSNCGSIDFANPICEHNKHFSDRYT